MPVLSGHHIQRKILSIKSVQGCAARFIFKDYSIYSSATEMLYTKVKLADSSPLLRSFKGFKILHNLIDIPDTYRTFALSVITLKVIQCNYGNQLQE